MKKQERAGGKKAIPRMLEISLFNPQELPRGYQKILEGCVPGRTVSGMVVDHKQEKWMKGWEGERKGKTNPW